ncbi:hypothetical protein [Burkholderia sp. SRS-W-2-2016]|uniref:hypothetical protein n=1 Tax=Burkholderia sp. SRS-W-2-2016 TaxID=1926878 RepID=UPI00118171E0|nr:hypothetical protein [Burkholderia sp. SRS-W-2-2016]
MGEEPDDSVGDSKAHAGSPPCLIADFQIGFSCAAHIVARPTYVATRPFAKTQSIPWLYCKTAVEEPEELS